MQYKKWLTTYQLNLNDKKVRAAGAPPRETALDALGIMNLLHSTTATSPSNGQKQQQQQQPPAAATATRSPARRSFSFSAPPAHLLTLHPPSDAAWDVAPGAGAGPTARSSWTAQAAEQQQQAAVDPFLRHARFRLEAPSRRRVDFVLQTPGGGVELRQLPAGFPTARLAAELQLDRAPGFVVLVNQRPPAPGQALRSGDLVRVVARSAAFAAVPVAVPAVPAVVAKEEREEVVVMGSSAPAAAPASSSMAWMARAALAARRQLEALAAAGIVVGGGGGVAAAARRQRRLSTGAGVPVAAAAASVEVPAAQRVVSLAEGIAAAAAASGGSAAAAAAAAAGAALGAPGGNRGATLVCV